MTLENVFFVVGIIFVLSSWLVVVGVGIASWLLYRRLKEIEQQLKNKISDFNLSHFSIKSLKSTYPLLLSGVIGLGYKIIKKRIFSS